MKPAGEVFIDKEGKTYHATFEVEHGMLTVRTHTETRTAQLGNSAPDALATQLLSEIVNAARPE